MTKKPTPVVDVALVPRARLEELAAAIAELQAQLATLQKLAKK